MRTLVTEAIDVAVSPDLMALLSRFEGTPRRRFLKAEVSQYAKYVAAALLIRERVGMLGSRLDRLRGSQLPDHQ